MRNHQIECTETLFQLFRGGVILGPNQLNINHLGAGTIKISLFQGPIFQHFIVVFAAESPYLWYRQKDPKNARMDYTTGVYDKFYGHNRTDEAWQAQNQITQNDTARLLHTE